MDFTVGIVLRNQATMSNFLKFRDSWNFMFLKARRGVRDTWHFMSGSRGATCPMQNGSNMSSSEGPMGDMWQLLIGEKSQSGWISG